MNLIIPKDLFIWYSAPVDFNNLWKKLNHEEIFKEWFNYYIEKGFKKYYLYREHVSFRRQKDGSLKSSYFTFLFGSYSSKERAEYWIQFDKDHFLKDPYYMYQYCGFI